MSRLVSTLTLALLTLALSSCSGSSGESCKASGDCDDGLVCCGLGSVVTGGARGVCQSACVLLDTGVTGTDLGVDTGTDVGVDTGTDVGVDSGSDTGTDVGVDTGTDADVDTGT